jgi:N utilization substance protein A
MKYNEETLGFIKLFENVTKAKVKDFYYGTRLIFIVNEGDIGRAIGKGGVNIKKLINLFNKKIKIVEYDKDIKKFIKNLIAPIKGKVYIEEDKVIIEGKGARFKKEVLGKGRRNLKEYQDITSKYFNYKLWVK